MSRKVFLSSLIRNEMDLIWVYDSLGSRPTVVQGTVGTRGVDPNVEDDCRNFLNRLQPMQGQQGQIQQVDNTVAVDVAGNNTRFS